jgi:hypothetical protein
MSLIEVRKFMTVVEEIWHEGGTPATSPLKMGAVAAVLKNPYAGKYVQDIMPMMDALKPFGLDMAKRLIAALGGEPKKIEGYGKGAIVGVAGELGGTCRGAMRCASFSATRRPSYHRRRRWARPGRASTCRSRISTRPTCARISTPWRSALQTPRAPTRSC